MADVLIDTDVFIDHLRGARRLVLDGDNVNYSVITRCELFAGRATEEDLVNVLLSPFTELPLVRSVAERAGRLRRETGARIADALIAATAIEHDLSLVTRNVRDFVQVSGLQLREPR